MPHARAGPSARSYGLHPLFAQGHGLRGSARRRAHTMRTPNEAPSKRRFAMPYRIDNIDPRTTVMIVVDMQNDFVAEGAKLQSAQAHAMVPKLAATLRFCREKGIRVVYTAHVHRRDGCDMGLYDDLLPLAACTPHESMAPVAARPRARRLKRPSVQHHSSLIAAPLTSYHSQ